MHGTIKNYRYVGDVSLSHLGLLSYYHHEESEGSKTNIFPSKSRGGKELASSSALDSPSVMSKLATPPHAINSDMSQVIDDATSAMDNAHDDASTLLDNDDVPLGDFLDKQIARVIQQDVVESDDELETKTPKTPARTSLPRYELPKVPEGYVKSE